jgi:gamma-glutamylcyclotransferase (GGCT)/AIG2-like uncharacterized protein YtfP
MSTAVPARSGAPDEKLPRRRSRRALCVDGAESGRAQAGGVVTTRVFVYGTLKPGQPRWPVLARFAVRAGADSLASAQGELFDTGYGWPAAVFDSRFNEQVYGAVVTVRSESVDEALATLDAVEDVAGGLFRRILVEIGGQPSWAYEWPGPTDEFCRIACWPAAEDHVT